MVRGKKERRIIIIIIIIRTLLIIRNGTKTISLQTMFGRLKYDFMSDSDNFQSNSKIDKGRTI